MKRLLVLAVLTAACFSAAPAQAHLISKADAESRWYFVFNDECGAGTPSCNVRNLYLDCTHPSGWVHSYSCFYQYRERKSGLPTSIYDYRTCAIQGTLTHSTVASSQKNCTGWS